MSGSKHFAELARKIIEDSDKGAKEREQRWRARQLMQQLKVGDTVPKAAEVDDSKKKRDNKGAGDGKMADIDMACACDASCNYAIVLANLSRVLWMAYEEYELLHACYADLFIETHRPSMSKKVATYWRTFVLNPRPAAPHKHPERLLRSCQAERTIHLKEKSELPNDPVAPLRRSFLSRLLDPFGCVKCRCLRCSNLDAVMDYRVALFSVLTEYCYLFEDYARLFWCSSIQMSESGVEVTVTASELDIRMFGLTMSELYTAMSFLGENHNVMKSLDFVRNLIYR